MVGITSTFLVQVSRSQSGDDMAKKPHPAVTQKHVDNAKEIASILEAMKGAGQQEPAPEPGPPPPGVSPLGGTAK